MIKDPIEIDAPRKPSRNDLFDRHPDLDMFIVRHVDPMYLGYLRQDKDEGCNVHFAIVYNKNVLLPRYHIGYDPVTKEEFLDFVSANYPEHFEWILWHPEWL